MLNSNPYRVSAPAPDVCGCVTVPDSDDVPGFSCCFGVCSDAFCLRASLDFSRIRALSILMDCGIGVSLSRASSTTEIISRIWVTSGSSVVTSVCDDGSLSSELSMGLSNFIFSSTSLRLTSFMYSSASFLMATISRASRVDGSLVRICLSVNAESGITCIFSKAAISASVTS